MNYFYLFIYFGYSLTFLYTVKFNIHDFFEQVYTQFGIMRLDYRRKENEGRCKGTRKTGRKMEIGKKR